MMIELKPFSFQTKRLKIYVSVFSIICNFHLVFIGSITSEKAEDTSPSKYKWKKVVFKTIFRN